MRVRSPKDFWAGLFFIAIALGFMLLSTRYSMGNMHRMGPARPFFAIWWPSSVVTTDDDSPGMFTRIAVVGPPYCAP